MLTLEQVAAYATQAMKQLGLDSVLIGGLAFNIWAESGGQFDTEDVDLMIVVDRNSGFNVLAFVKAFSGLTAIKTWFVHEIENKNATVCRFKYSQDVKGTVIET